MGAMLYSGVMGSATGVLLARGEWRVSVILTAIVFSTWRVAWPLEQERRGRDRS